MCVFICIVNFYHKKRRKEPKTWVMMSQYSLCHLSKAHLVLRFVILKTFPLIHNDYYSQLLTDSMVFLLSLLRLILII